MLPSPVSHVHLYTDPMHIRGLVALRRPLSAMPEFSLYSIAATTSFRLSDPPSFAMGSFQWLSLLLHVSLCFSVVLPEVSRKHLSLLSQLADSNLEALSGKSTASASPQRIAIIGSGITGASAAFDLAENGRLRVEGKPLITIFERNLIIGGRITTTQVYNDPRMTIDTCAATFEQIVDTCISQLATSVGLMPETFQPTQAGVGIWDGESFVGFIEDEGFRDPMIWTPARQARWFQRYGNVPWDYSRNVSEKQLSYQQLGLQGFTSLAEEVKRNKLRKLVGENVCENELLDCKDAEQQLFLKEVVGAGIRERFFGDYDQLNGVDAVLGLSTENGLVSVSGGNLRLIDRLTKLSGAHLELGATVKKLKQNTNGNWTLNFVQENVLKSLEFDAVILAAPFGLSNITFEPALQPDMTEGLNLSYIDTYVTHFTTRSRLNASFFNLSGPAPQNILTTKNPGSAPFFDLIQINEALRNPENRRLERLYKIVSEQQISDDQLCQWLEQVESPTEPTITWINREPLLQSVPRLERNQTIQGAIEIAPRLFYAGGGEQVAATIEFACRMGQNAARLILPPEQQLPRI